jgi:hypothetical protein
VGGHHAALLPGLRLERKRHNPRPAPGALGHAPAFTRDDPIRSMAPGVIVIYSSAIMASTVLAVYSVCLR